MSVLEVDSSNACIPPSSPLYSLIPPLPSTTRGEPLKSLDSYIFNDKHVILYGNGRLIVCRYIVLDNQENRIQAFIYRGHMAQVTCARFSPSGAYVASSDIRGNLRVWSYDNEEHLCKLNLPRALGGPIRDIAWDKQNRRLCIVGDTSPSDPPCRFIHWDTGVTCGELGMHQRNRVSCCSIRRVKEGYNAYTILTGGREDHSILLNASSPRSLELNDLHTRGAIHAIKFSNNGLHVASVGADHTICIFEYGDTLDLKHRIEEGHAGSIYSCDFNYDDTELITCSVDGTVKLWNVETGTLLSTIDVFKLQLQAYDDDYIKNYKGGMQIGCKYISNTTAVSISSNGRISILNPPHTKIIMGHQSPIAAMSYHDNIVYTGDTDGIICKWDLNNGECIQINGVEKVHTGTITSLQYVQGKVLSVGWDDTMRISNDSLIDSVKLEYQPNLIIGGVSISVIVTVGGIVLVKDAKLVSDTIPLPYEALSACLSHTDQELCLGGNDNNIYIYTIQNNQDKYSIKHEHTIQSGHLNPIQSLSFSHDSKYLASADSRDICIWNFDLKNCTPVISKNRWCFHSQKITSLAWNPKHSVIASAGLDDSIYLWCLDKKMKRVHYAFSHRGGINGLVFVSEFLLLSVGNDGCICVWDVREDLVKKFGIKV